MKNTVSYYTKDSLEQFNSSLVVSNKILTKDNLFFEPDPSNFIGQLKRNILNTIHTNTATSSHDITGKKEVTYSDNLIVVSQETSKNILTEVTKFINTEGITIKEKRAIIEKFDNTIVNINKIKKQPTSSALVIFNKVDLELDLGLILVDGPDSSQETIKFQELIDIWCQRSTFLNKQHLFIILETKNDDVSSIKHNEFIRIIKKNYLFKSVSLLILPNLDTAKDYKFNNHNFIGNKITILRDFNINLVTNPEYQNSNINSKDYNSKFFKESLNNTKINNYGYDEKLEKQGGEESSIVKKKKSGKANPEITTKKVFYCSIKYPNGEYYEGEVNSDNQPHGLGTLIYLDSTTYSGYFVNSKRHGKGCLINPDFSTSYMIWKEDRQNGFMKKYHFDECTLLYEGRVENGKYHGAGKLVFDNGKFEGFFDKGKRVVGTIYLKDKKGKLYEAYKGLFDNDQPGKHGKVSIPHSSKENFFNVYIGEVIVKETGEIEVTKGSLQINHVKTSPADSCYGTNDKHFPKTQEDGVWRIDKTAVATTTLIRTNQYFERLNLNKDEYADKITEYTSTDNIAMKGFVGLVRFFNHDIFIGETADYLPNGFGILYRHAKNQYEVGQFSKINYNADDKQRIRHYFLDEGIQIRSKDSFELINRKEYISPNLTTEYMETVQFDGKENKIFKGRVIPIWEKLIVDKKEKPNKNNLVEMKKTDINSIFYDFNKNTELMAIVKDNVVISGRFNDKNNKNVYTGKLNENVEFHGYGEIVFGNHPLYKKYVGEFVNGEIHGLGEIEYKSLAVEKGFFIRNKKKNDKKPYDINTATYSVKGSNQMYYPTMCPVYTTGFKVGNHSITDTYLSRQTNQQSNSIILKKAAGKTNFNQTIKKEVYELDNKDAERKINILIENLVDSFRIMALTFEKDGKLAKVNVKMGNDFTYYGSLNSNFQMHGVGRLKLSEGGYIGNFQNDMYHGEGQREEFRLQTGQHKKKDAETVKMKIVEIGTFVQDKLHGEICQKTLAYADPNMLYKPSMKGDFALQYGKFVSGELIEGCKEVFSITPNPTPVMLVGRFHVPGIKDLEFVNKKDSKDIITHSKPILKGVKMVKAMSNTSGMDIFGGKIVESKYIPGKYTMFKSGIRFYSINYQITEKIQKLDYRIKLISQFTEYKETVSNWEDIEHLKQTINGKGRLYRLSASSPQMNEKTTRNELNDNLNILYEGDFLRGRFNGKGIVYYDNGDMFFGDIKDSELDLSKNLLPNKGSFGTLIQPLVGIQTGFFENEKLNGKAVVIYQNGIKYRGETKNGRNHGKGVLYFPDGTHYEGHFNSDKLVGLSKFYYSNGDCLVCSLDENSQINGNGVYTFKDGTEVQGQFVGNIMYGLGTKKIQELEIIGGLRNFEPFGTVCIKNKYFRAYGTVDEQGIFHGKVSNKKTGSNIEYSGKYDLSDLNESQLKKLGQK